MVNAVATRAKLKRNPSTVDVARLAGVSQTTVSFVLNPATRSKVADDTARKVLDAVDALGYRPNLFARRLHGKPSNTLGLMLSGLQNPFFVSMARAFERTGPTVGYKVVLDTTIGSPWVYHKHDAWLVDGVFIFSGAPLDHDYYFGAQADQMPIVYLGCQDVVFDLYDGARQIAEYLLSRGYKKIACITQVIDDPRIRAFDDICNGNEVAVERIHVKFIDDAIDAFAVGTALANRPQDDRPDVVFCAGDSIAIAVYHAVRRSGLRVPEDIGIAGFDGIVEGQYMDKPLTTVISRVDKLVAAAFDLMINALSDEAEERREDVVIPTTLSIGQTTR